LTVAERVAVRAYVATKLGKFIAKVWMVRGPLPHDLSGRPSPKKLIFEMTVPRLVEYLAKIGLSRWENEQGALHTDASSAMQDAETRFERWNNRFNLPGRLAGEEETKEGFAPRKKLQRPGEARKRRKQYRKTKQKSKTQAKRYRATHKTQIRKTQKRYRRNPGARRMRRRADAPEVTELDIPIWDLGKDRGGEIDQLNLDDETVTVTYDDGGAETLDVLALLDNAVLVDPEDEAELWESLDAEFGGDDDDDDDDELVEKVATRYAYWRGWTREDFSTYRVLNRYRWATDG